MGRARLGLHCGGGRGGELMGTHLSEQETHFSGSTRKGQLSPQARLPFQFPWDISVRG